MKEKKIEIKDRVISENETKLAIQKVFIELGFEPLGKEVNMVVDAIEKIPSAEKSMIEKIANMLGVELYEEFKIRPTKIGEVMGCKTIDRTFRFDTELVYKGYNDGWSEWYGFECDKILYKLILGKYEIIKE